MPNNTVRLDRLPQITAGSRLADVKAGTITLAEYLHALEQRQGVRAGWQPDGSYLIDFGKGILDPNGLPLDIGEVLEIVKALMPSPLASALKTIRLRGPMPAAAAALVCRVCYAATIIIEVIDRTTGMIREVPIEKLDRDWVRLVNPDTNERERDLGDGYVEVRTSQLRYRRRKNGPRFNYTGELQLALIETNNPQRPRAAAQVFDGRYHAWVDNLNDLADVVK